MSRRNPVRRETMVHPPTEKILRTMPDMRVRFSRIRAAAAKKVQVLCSAFPARSGEGRNPPHNSSLRARRQAGLSAELGLAARLRRGRLLDRPLLFLLLLLQQLLLLLQVLLLLQLPLLFLLLLPLLALLPLQLLLSLKLLLALQVRRSVVRRGAAWRLLPGLRNGERLDLDRLLAGRQLLLTLCCAGRRLAGRNRLRGRSRQFLQRFRRVERLLLDRLLACRKLLLAGWRQRLSVRPRRRRSLSRACGLRRDDVLALELARAGRRCDGGLAFVCGVELLRLHAGLARVAHLKRGRPNMLLRRIPLLLGRGFEEISAGAAVVAGAADAGRNCDRLGIDVSCAHRAEIVDRRVVEEPPVVPAAALVAEPVVAVAIIDAPE